MNKTIVITILLVVLAGFLFWGFQTGFFVTLFSGPAKTVEPAPLPQGIVLFYGAECPHCKIVEAFLVANSIDQKVKFTQLEVPFFGKTSSQLEANAGLAIQIAQSCKIDTTNGISIPFLYDGTSKCITGDTDVINFFKNAANIK